MSGAVSGERPEGLQTASSDLDQWLDGIQLDDLQLEPTPEQLTLHERYDALDNANEGFLDACGDYAAEPSEGTTAAVSAHGTAMMTELRNAITTINETFGPNNLPAIHGLLVKHDEQCVEGFRDLTNKDGLFPVKPEFIENLLQSYAEKSDTLEEFTDSVVGYFGRALMGDINIFMKKANEKYQQLMANLTTVSFNANPLEYVEATDEYEAGHYYGFSIEPPITVHSPNFMQDTELTFSNSKATYGNVWVPESVHADEDAEEAQFALQQYLMGRFDQALNPMGNLAVRFLWGEPIHTAPDETAEPELPPAED